MKRKPQPLDKNNKPYYFFIKECRSRDSLSLPTAQVKRARKTDDQTRTASKLYSYYLFLQTEDSGFAGKLTPSMSCAICTAIMRCNQY